MDNEVADSGLGDVLLPLGPDTAILKAGARLHDARIDLREAGGFTASLMVRNPIYRRCDRETAHRAGARPACS